MKQLCHSIKVRCSAIEDMKRQLADRLKALKTCWGRCILKGWAFWLGSTVNM